MALTHFQLLAQCSLVPTHLCRLRQGEHLAMNNCVHLLLFYPACMNNLIKISALKMTSWCDWFGSIIILNPFLSETQYRPRALRPISIYALWIDRNAWSQEETLGLSTRPVSAPPYLVPSWLFVPLILAKGT